MMARRNWLRRHWLSGAFVCTLLGVASYAALNFYETELKLQHVRATKEQLRVQLDEATRRNQELDQELSRLSGDEYMEQMAKKLGYSRPNETVFQKDKGN
jgi:cell division protein FtsB